MTADTFGKKIWKRSLIVAALLGLLIVFLYAARNILLPFFIAFLVAYVLDPMVDKLEEWHIPRIAGILIIILALLLVIALVVLFLYPRVHSQFTQLVDRAPHYYEVLKGKIGPWVDKFNIRYPGALEESTAKLREFLRNNAPDLAAPVTRFLQHSFSSAVNFFLGLLNVIVIPVFAFYLLKDIDVMMEKIKSTFPLRYRDWLLDRFREVDEAMGSFIRGQITVAMILAFLYSAGLMLVGVPMGLLIGLTAGIANIVPYLGPVVGIVPSCLLVYIEHGSLWRIIGVLGVFAFAQTLEGMVITPRIMGEKMGLHPLTVIVAIIIGGELFGFLGILLAVPGAATVLIFAKSGYEAYKKSDLYRAKPAEQ